MGQLMASMGRNFSRVGSISGAESESGQTQNVMKYEKFDCLVTIKCLMFVELVKLANFLPLSMEKNGNNRISSYDGDTPKVYLIQHKMWKTDD